MEGKKTMCTPFLKNIEKFPVVVFFHCENFSVLQWNKFRTVLHKMQNSCEIMIVNRRVLKALSSISNSVTVLRGPTCFLFCTSIENFQISLKAVCTPVTKTPGLFQLNETEIYILCGGGWLNKKILTRTQIKEILNISKEPLSTLVTQFHKEQANGLLRKPPFLIVKACLRLAQFLTNK